MAGGVVLGSKDSFFSEEDRQRIDHFWQELSSDRQKEIILLTSDKPTLAHLFCRLLAKLRRRLRSRGDNTIPIGTLAFALSQLKSSTIVCLLSQVEHFSKWESLTRKSKHYLINYALCVFRDRHRTTSFSGSPLFDKLVCQILNNFGHSQFIDNGNRQEHYNYNECCEKCNPSMAIWCSCLSAMYCSRACRDQDWHSHKNSCVVMWCGRISSHHHLPVKVASLLVSFCVPRAMGSISRDSKCWFGHYPICSTLWFGDIRCLCSITNETNHKSWFLSQLIPDRQPYLTDSELAIICEYSDHGDITSTLRPLSVCKPLSFNLFLRYWVQNLELAENNFSDFVTSWWDSKWTIWNKLEDVKHFQCEEIVPAALVSQYIAGLATYVFLLEAETENQLLGSSLKAFSEFPPIWVRKPDTKQLKSLSCVWCRDVFKQTTYSDWSLHITKHLAPELYSGHLKQIKLLSGPDDSLKMDQFVCSICKFPTRSKHGGCHDLVCTLKRQVFMISNLSHTI